MPQRACPKCGFEQPDYHTECAQCGIVFTKYSSQREAFARAQASQTVPPQPSGVRPFTLFLLVAYLILGWVAVNRLGIVDKLSLFVGPEEGISQGGAFSIRARQRIVITDLAAPAADASADPDAPPPLPPLYGLPQIADAEPLAGAPPGATHFRTRATFDDAMAHYQAILGPTRLIRATIGVPANSTLHGTRSEVTSRHAHWFVRYVDGEGDGTDVDLELQSPYFDHDGSFVPDATRIAFVVPAPESPATPATPAANP